MPEETNNPINDLIQAVDENTTETNTILEHSLEQGVRTGKIVEAHLETADKTYSEIKKMSDKKMAIEIEIDGAETIMYKGEKGDKGDKGDTPSDEVLKKLIKPLIPEPIKGEDGRTPTEEELISLIEPLIPEPIKGEDGSNYILSDQDKQDIADSIEVPVVEKVIEKVQVIKEVPKKEKPEELKKKIESLGIDYEKLSNTPDIETMMNVVRKTSSKTVSLVELDDVDLSGVTITNGKYVLGSGGGGGTVGPGTTNEIAYFNAPTTITSLPTATYPSLTELAYVKGVTSAIQTQLNSKGTGNGDALVANPLSQFASTTSLQLKGVISDETGSGSLVFGTAPTFATSITTPSVLATADDSGTLGASGTAFSDLFLASGAVINFNAGNVTITHTAGTLTLNNTALGLGSGAITTTGNVSGNNWLGTTAVRAGASSFFYWNGLARMYSPSDGVIQLTDNATTSFNRLQFGGTTSSFPSIKRSSAILQARLADDSAYTDLEVADEAYGVGWNGSLEVPTKNALYDKIETLGGGGATTALDNLAGVAINAALVLGTSDAFALGSTTKMWSDLFLASGAVINFNAGNVTITHTAGTLTLNNTALGLGSGAITTTGNVTANSFLGLGSVRAGVSSLIYWNGSTQMKSPSDGVITMWDNANTSFNRLQFGGTTSSFPSIKRSGTTLAFRLADDSDDAPISVSNINVSGSMYLNADNKARISGNTNGVFDFNYNTAGTGGLNFWGGGTTAVWSTDYQGNQYTAGTLDLGHATDTTLSRSSAGVLAVEGVVIPSISSTNTFTNKRITKRVTALTSSATPTINTDNCDAVDITALATAITSMTTNLSGTPSNKDTLVFQIKDDGTARAITWGASFVAGGVALPTTTVISKILTVGFIYNTANALNKWMCIASAQEA